MNKTLYSRALLELCGNAMINGRALDGVTMAGSDLLHQIREWPIALVTCPVRETLQFATVTCHST